MTKFVKVINNKVVDSIVAEQDHINTLSDKDFWIKNDGTKFNIAGIGYTYDALRDAFIAPKPFNSWTLNEETCQWEAPVPMPDDNKRYIWNEETKQWEDIDE
tara:strand:- start:172 stop:477 length:306 start_codon:yes stop_codon:yes gene_type:complete